MFSPNAVSRSPANPSLSVCSATSSPDGLLSRSSWELSFFGGGELQPWQHSRLSGKLHSKCRESREWDNATMGGPVVSLLTGDHWTWSFSQSTEPYKHEYPRCSSTGQRRNISLEKSIVIFVSRFHRSRGGDNLGLLSGSRSTDQQMNIRLRGSAVLRLVRGAQKVLLFFFFVFHSRISFPVARLRNRRKKTHSREPAIYSRQALRDVEHSS
ncbi:hypothetical protein BDP55DRAFT_659279 [Colletotrichum godetiae]|uniref:Uncharacterized protein n=1 Tax=Colletotrichum godetiae TaxID=1209918 RepID=A0AAJ0AP02_9PEZI|nr:uncharacterized protein BDP55DRAFT_659279 [Colletotrichum godetiae]KAK1687726.1 hypothetical protein BDP55DRAFT_659279 [Colletotrichum godetiae]